MIRPGEERSEDPDATVYSKSRGGQALMIPLQRPSMSDEELRAVAGVFATGWLGMGDEVTKFEEELAAFLGARRVLAVNSGTSALHLALECLELPAGSEVIVPSQTFMASVQAIISAGLTPVFADVEEETMNLSARTAAPMISGKTRVIMPVHYRGHPCELAPIVALAEKHGAVVVEDAAHAIGSEYAGRKIGASGHVTCFSFDPIKNITCGEGGAVVTSSERFDGAMELARRMRVLGMDLDTWSRYQTKRPFHYDVVSDGFRYHMPNISAAIGRSQLRRFGELAGKRRSIAERYTKALAGHAAVKPLPVDVRTTVPFMYVVLVEQRAAFMEHLKANGVMSGIHYIPNHRHTRFRRFRAAPMEVTDRLSEQIVTLPLFPDQTDEQVERVIEVVRSF